jgi:hypothetical protein
MARWRIQDCIPCAPKATDSASVAEKFEVERVAVSLYSEGKISASELDSIVSSDRIFHIEISASYG